MQSTKIYDQCYNLENINIRKTRGMSLVVQWLRLCLAMQGTQVRSLVWEPRSHMPRNSWAHTPQLESPRAATKEPRDATNASRASTKTQLSQVNKQANHSRCHLISIKKSKGKKTREETTYNILADNNINKSFYLIDLINQKLCYSAQFSRSVVSDSLRPHELQHARPPCPSATPGVHPNPCPLSQWCHPTISSSVSPSPPALSLS